MSDTEFDDIISVLTDKLRSRGESEERVQRMSRWLKNPEAVELLLGFDPQESDFGCASCFAPVDGVHKPECAVLKAWVALGDPRVQRDVERAWDLANGPWAW